MVTTQSNPSCRITPAMLIIIALLLGAIAWRFFNPLPQPQTPVYPIIEYEYEWYEVSKSRLDGGRKTWDKFKNEYEDAGGKDWLSVANKKFFSINITGWEYAGTLTEDDKYVYILIKRPVTPSALK